MLLLFGFNQFLHFLPEHSYPDKAQEFITALNHSQYVFYTVGLTQIALAVALLFKKYISLALIIFTPVLVNVILFHLFLDTGGLLKVIPTLICFVYFTYQYRYYFAHLLKTSKNGIIQ